jgi:hypothetical protein
MSYFLSHFNLVPANQSRGLTEKDRILKKCPKMVPVLESTPLDLPLYVTSRQMFVQ